MVLFFWFELVARRLVELAGIVEYLAEFFRGVLWDVLPLLLLLLVLVFVLGLLLLFPSLEEGTPTQQR